MKLLLCALALTSSSSLFAKELQWINFHPHDISFKTKPATCWSPEKLRIILAGKKYPATQKIYEQLKGFKAAARWQDNSIEICVNLLKATPPELHARLAPPPQNAVLTPIDLSKIKIDPDFGEYTESEGESEGVNKIPDSP